jgi:hypothetical protein
MGLSFQALSAPTQNLATLVILLSVVRGGAVEPAPLVKSAPGFFVEQVFVVPAHLGSWVSLCADDRGVLYAGDQTGPLYRIELPSARRSAAIMPLELAIGGIHGMTWHAGKLYAVVGERDICQPGLYHLSDENRDGQLDTVSLLQKLDGHGEHGPHTVIATPNGDALYVLAGNATALPPLIRSRVPKIWQSDSLTQLPAVMGSETRGLAHGGWICRTGLDGRQWELICMGLRNAYALACSADGESFTCDSDTEFEIGTPWYRPNRVLHCVSGADFGWRPGSLKTPEHSLDTLPPVASIGPGSPTAVLFAAGAALPARYRNALLIGDWSFGRLLAVHLKPAGAGFAAHSEEIVTGTPLAITAACIHPLDKSIYFVTGGRKTQSILYRLTTTRASSGR